MNSGKLAILCAVLLTGCRGEAPSRTVRVAVAANFAGVQDELAARFTQQTGDTVQRSVGASGQFYAQIKNGAPFDVFLSADAERPRLLEEEGLAVKDSRFTYAIGQLVLYAPHRDSSRAAGPELLKEPFTHIAITNPKTAPYGAAAMEAVKSMQAEAAVTSKVVQGETLVQTLQFVTSGAAELGFVALSQVMKEPPHRYWIVPRNYHSDIVQDAVLLRTGENNAAARAYLEFLRSAEAQAIIKSRGYAVPATN